MRYRFNEFEFDSESLLLTKNDEALAIRHTEAKVLAVLLEQVDTVLNKEDILSLVWQNKIVSEQVVFQNISHLRNLFGIDAIKTFPKRGYQWQLNTEVVTPETQFIPDNLHSQNVFDSSQQSPHLRLAKKRGFWQLVGLTCIIFITFVVIYSPNKLVLEKSHSVIKLAYIPMTNLDHKTRAKHEDIILEDAIFEDNSDFDFTVLSHLDTELFEDAIETEYPKLSKTHRFILTGKIRTYKQQTYLDFMVTGPFSDWPGQLSGSSKQDVFEQMQRHLKQQIIYDFISKPQPLDLKQARLSIAHQVSPNDLIILRKLSIFYYKTDELEKAMVMADKLINLAQSQNNTQHMGRALLYQSKILTKKKLYDLSAQKLKLAIEQFEKINDL
ncbi:MAG: winged helix-turn-helix domain-containing protein, partial [Colwellia sp.]|nr:winged helix-turn-helix domain-containing protein [Colwellia sp.]